MEPVRKPIDLPELEHAFTRALKELMHALRKATESELKSQGAPLPMSHCMVLQILAREPGISGSTAAKRAQITAQSMNALLRGAESSGCAVRECNPENARADRWFLTREGLSRLRQSKRTLDGVISKMLAPLGEQNAQSVAQMLQQCSNALSDEGGPIES